jgi:antitoxin FitA
MVALQIRDVPDDVRDALAERARERGQSLQAYLLDMVEADARRARNRAVLARFGRRRDGVRTAPGEIAAQIAAARPSR